MDWYLVKIIYRIICGDGKHAAQFDEQIRLLSAPSLAEALEKGRLIGKQEEEVFYNNRHQLVSWKFIEVTELYPINELTDGAEVFSQIKEIDHAEDYCRFAHHKHALLHQQATNLTLQTT